MNINIIYWSGTGNTENMANFIKDGAESCGAIVTVRNVSEADEKDIEGYDVVCFGCPSMGAENLEESEFEPFIESIEPIVSGKKIALFGSYGWGDGQWMREWSERMTNAGAVLVQEGLIVNYSPEGDECKEFGIQITK